MIKQSLIQDLIDKEMETRTKKIKETKRIITGKISEWKNTLDSLIKQKREMFEWKLKLFKSKSKI